MSQGKAAILNQRAFGSKWSKNSIFTIYSIANFITKWWYRLFSERNIIRSHSNLMFVITI